MKIPSYLAKNIKDYREGDYAIMTICSTAGNEKLEIWYYGEWLKVGKVELLVDTEQAPVLIVAKDPLNGEEIMIFDGAKYGYDNMFCDSYSQEQISSRVLSKLDISPSKLILSLGYSIDYEEEKEDYDFDFDENNDVILVDGRKMSWEDVKLNGFDYLNLSYITDDGETIEFADFELA